MKSPLRQYLELNNSTVDKLAASLGVNRTTIWRWETGKVPVERLADIERLTKIPRQQLRPDIFGEAAQ
jgi:DNA-binding transcriptional regulator YdaS (Cro superfamily)